VGLQTELDLEGVRSVRGAPSVMVPAGRWSRRPGGPAADAAYGLADLVEGVDDRRAEGGGATADAHVAVPAVPPPGAIVTARVTRVRLPPAATAGFARCPRRAAALANP
jgi:hypothetical protein